MRILGGNIGAGCNEQPHDLRVTTQCRAVKWRVSVHCADCVNRRSASKENDSDAREASGRSQMQRCVAAAVGCRDVSALVEQQLGDVCMLAKGKAGVKRRDLLIVSNDLHGSVMHCGEAVMIISDEMRGLSVRGALTPTWNDTLESCESRCVTS